MILNKHLHLLVQETYINSKNEQQTAGRATAAKATTDEEDSHPDMQSSDTTVTMMTPQEPRRKVCRRHHSSDNLLLFGSTDGTTTSTKDTKTKSLYSRTSNDNNNTGVVRGINRSLSSDGTTKTSASTPAPIFAKQFASNNNNNNVTPTLSKRPSPTKFVPTTTSTPPSRYVLTFRTHLKNMTNTKFPTKLQKYCAVLIVFLCLQLFVAHNQLIRKSSSSLSQSNSNIGIESNNNNHNNLRHLFTESQQQHSTSSLSNNNNNKMKTQGKYAYVYLLGGCNPDKPAYRGFLYNIIISTFLQRQKGSVADVIVFVQMSYNHSSSEQQQDLKLPEDEYELLVNRMNIQVQYIPSDPKEDFIRLNMEKFRIFNMTTYDRILFLDSDIMSVNNLDYLFDLSMQGIIEENMIMAHRLVPALGGFVLITPNSKTYQRIWELILQPKRNNSGNVKNDNTDDELHPFYGWGHPFVGVNDYYELASGKRGQSWNFPEAQGDQGLLYHVLKYESNSVSILVKDVIHNWNTNASGQQHKKDVPGNGITIKHRNDIKLIDLFSTTTSTPHCWQQFLNHNPCISPYSDFIHFQIGSKPWLSPPPSNLTQETSLASPNNYWYYTLGVINEKYNIGLSMQKDDWHIRPLLGLQPRRGSSHHSSASVGRSGNNINDDRPQLNDMIVQLNSSSHATGRYAYVYVVGGCDPENPAYRFYIYDILISTYNQRSENSQADVIVLFQMLYKTDYEKLPQEDIRLLEAMNITVMYIPKSNIESFYRIMLDKFRILDLIKYDRVIFMDSDVMAVGSLDYLFELSMAGKIKKNLIFAGPREPAQGGTFMLAPRDGAWERIISIINEKEMRGIDLPYPHWDDVKGWGHVINQETDYYQFVGSNKKGHNWTFYGAFADQGLLYHWTKYEEKSVSIVFQRKIENWGIGSDGEVALEGLIGIDVVPIGIAPNRPCWPFGLNHKPCAQPHNDLVHFTSLKKPWLRGPPEDYLTADPTTSPWHYWFHILSLLNTKLEMGLDFDNWHTKMRPALGMYPKLVDAANTKYYQTAAKLKE